MCKTYEIWDVDTQEVLVDNLTFEEAAEQSAVYMNYYEGISVAIRKSKPIRHHKTNAQVYKETWVKYFGELQLMGNLN